MKANIFPAICRKMSIWLLASMSLAMVACDDGKIYPDDSAIEATGFTLTMKGELTGCGQYDNTNFTVALAAFEEDNDFAVVSKNLYDGSDDVTLTNIDRKVATVEICIINRLRKRIFSLKSENVEGKTENDVVFNAGDVNVGMFKVINSEIFTKTCLQCHGGTGTSAAGLDLSPEKAYADLVGVPSRVVEGEMIVAPGDASASTLWQIVATDISDTWNFDHSNLLTTDKSSFIESWINKGAND